MSQELKGFTPGPWIIDRSHPEMEGLQIWADEMKGDVIANTVIIAHVVPDQHSQHEANAQLIAMAPTLYEENTKLKEHLELKHQVNIEKTLEVEKLQEQVRVLREALNGSHSFISNWLPDGDGNAQEEFQQQLDSMTEALNNTK